MTFTGTLIESLMATVERAERARPDEPLFAEHLFDETWLASVREDADYNPKFLGVA